jgi:hypothetical protein
MLPLSCLVSDTVTANTEKLKQELCTKGWAFLTNDNTGLFSYDCNYIQTELNNFDEELFQKKDSDKKTYRQVMYPANRFGFFQTGRKEGYRFMTGNRLKQFMFPGEPYTPNVEEHPIDSVPFKKIALACDQLSRKIIDKQGKYLFNIQSQESLSILPLMRDDAFGLFDIVKYNPQGMFSKIFQGTDSQVDEHADPGLFSISLGSTSEGLEMFDPVSKEWIAVPCDAMVLWCGHAVTDISGGQVIPGVHRVRATDKKRLTAWYEVCCDDQVPKRAVHMDDADFKREMELWEKEYSRGISMSKSRRPRPLRLSENQVHMGLNVSDVQTIFRQVKEERMKK